MPFSGYSESESQQIQHFPFSYITFLRNISQYISQIINQVWDTAVLRVSDLLKQRCSSESHISSGFSNNVPLVDMRSGGSSLITFIRVSLWVCFLIPKFFLKEFEYLEK